MKRKPIQIDRGKLRAVVRKLGSEEVFYMLDDAIEILPPTKLLEIALPDKRNRWLKLARHHRPVFNRAVELFGVEFFQDLLAGYGDLESSLWHILEQCGIMPPGLHVLAIAAAGVPFQTAAWNGKTTWPPN